MSNEAWIVTVRVANMLFFKFAIKLLIYVYTKIEAYVEFQHFLENMKSNAFV